MCGWADASRAATASTVQQEQISAAPRRKSLPAPRASAPRSCQPPGQGPPCKPVERPQAAGRRESYARMQFSAAAVVQHAVLAYPAGTSCIDRCRILKHPQPRTDTPAAAAQTQPQHYHALPGKHEQREVFKKGVGVGAGRAGGSSEDCKSNCTGPPLRSIWLSQAKLAGTRDGAPWAAIAPCRLQSRYFRSAHALWPAAAAAAAATTDLPPTLLLPTPPPSALMLPAARHSLQGMIWPTTPIGSCSV